MSAGSNEIEEQERQRLSGGFAYICSEEKQELLFAPRPLVLLPRKESLPRVGDGTLVVAPRGARGRIRRRGPVARRAPGCAPLGGARLEAEQAVLVDAVQLGQVALDALRPK